MAVMTNIAVPITGRRQRPMIAAMMNRMATRPAATARIALVGTTALTSVYSAPAQRPELLWTVVYLSSQKLTPSRIRKSAPVTAMWICAARLVKMPRSIRRMLPYR
ncbi:hypothetical protein D3C73_1030560 [compost metagenome]